MRRGFFCAREKALPLTRLSSQPALCEGGIGQRGGEGKAGQAGGKEGKPTPELNAKKQKGAAHARLLSTRISKQKVYK